MSTCDISHKTPRFYICLTFRICFCLIWSSDSLIISIQTISRIENYFLLFLTSSLAFNKSLINISFNKFTKTGKVSIPIEDIVSVCYPKRKNSASPSSPQQVFPIANGSQNTSINPGEITVEIAEDFRSFNINYAKRVIDPKVQEGGNKKNSGKSGKNANIWRIYSITMHNNDKYVIKEWHDTLTEIINSEFQCQKNSRQINSLLILFF